MRKVFLFFFCFTAVSAIGQQAYYDALTLRSFVDSSSAKFKFDKLSTNVYLPILAKYLPSSILNDGVPECSEVRDFFLQNPFFVNKGLENITCQATSPIIPGALSSIGNLDVTAFADGFAKFLVERAKEELNEAFFRKFADFLNYHPEFITLFPNTKSLINNFESWEYANVLNTLREAFDKDIKELLSNFVKLKDLSMGNCPSNCDESNPSDRCIACKNRVVVISDFFRTNNGIFLLSAAQIGNGILQSQKVPDIINSVTQPTFLLGYTDPAHTDVVDNIKNSLKLINIISISLKSKETSKNYITDSEFDLLKSDPILRNLYFGLLWQQMQNEKITINNTSLTAAFTPGNVDGITNYLTNIFTESKNIQKAYDKLLADKLDSKTDLGPDYAIIFESTNKFFSATTSVSLINPSLSVPVELTKVFNIAFKTLQIAHDIAIRNYNAVIAGTSKLLSDQIPEASAMKDFALNFVKYGSFAANVVLSKNSDEVKEAIKAVALPSGSSSIKKHSRWNLSLNAYAGIYFGSEKIKGVDDNFKANSIGVTAPIGLAISKGINYEAKSGWSLSFFLSFIDLGAPVAFRFTDDKTEKIPTVQLKDIISPGLFLSIGLPKAPISINTGWQMGPRLRNVDPSIGDKASSNYSRLSVSVLVDVPVFNIKSWTKL